MKKAICLILSLLLMCQLSTALAAVPSKTTGDLTDFIGAVDEQGQSLAETGFTITTGTAPAPAASQNGAARESNPSMADQLLSDIAQFIAKAYGSPIRYFGDDVFLQAVPLLPAGTDLDTLVLNEFFSASISGYDSAYGAVTASFTFASAYVPGQRMLALVGLPVGGQVAWYPMQAVCGAGGVVAISLSAELLVNARQGETLIAILSEQAA
jgi:hypothetical protein